MSTPTSIPQAVPPPPPPPVAAATPTARPTITFSPSSKAPVKSSSPSSTIYSVDYTCLHANSWLINKNNNYNNYFKSWTEIANSHLTSHGQIWSVLASQIPNYNKIFTAADIQTLNSRPKASTDFKTGQTTAVAGRNYTFGTNINYVTNSGCNLGYWPPGPVCPAAQNKVLNFTVTPAPANTGVLSEGSVVFAVVVRLNLVVAGSNSCSTTTS